MHNWDNLKPNLCTFLTKKNFYVLKAINRISKQTNWKDILKRKCYESSLPIWRTIMWVLSGSNMFSTSIYAHFAGNFDFFFAAETLYNIWKSTNLRLNDTLEIGLWLLSRPNAYDQWCVLSNSYSSVCIFRFINVFNVFRCIIDFFLPQFI